METAVSGKRAVGNTRIHDGDRSSTPFGKTQEIWPEFCLRENYEFGTKRFDIWTNGESKIERKIEEVFGAET